MNLKKFPQRALESVRGTARRFPLPLILVCLLTLAVIMMIFDKGGPVSQRFLGVIIYYLSVGFVLSLSLRLWSEERGRSVSTLLVNIIPHVALIADAIYIFFAIDSNGDNMELVVAHVSAVASIALSLCFLSFLKEKDNIASWNFTLRMICSLCLCVLVGLVMWGGVSLLLASLQGLFGMEFSYKWYEIFAVLTVLLLSALLLLGRIPQGQDKFSRIPLDSGFMSGVMRFLLLPLIGLYIIVLYIYAARILITWNLPNGNVSWLIIASMAGCIAIEFGLYPVRLSRGRKSDNIIARWLPVVILPLLLLMTVGIVRRISDYGITISRLYLITLNLWFYAVCIVLFVTRAKRINWITISFAAVFLLTSALPCNYTSITRHYMDARIKAAFKSAEVDKLPVTASQYDVLMKNMPKNEANMLNSRLMYVQSNYSTKAIGKYVYSSKEYVNFYQYIDELDIDADTVMSAETETQYCSNYAPEDLTYDIPKGYGKIYFLQNKTCKVSYSKENDTVGYPLDTMTDGVPDTIYISIKNLRKHANVMEKAITARCNSAKCTALITSFSIYNSADGDKINLTLDGVVFKKN